MSDRAPLKQFIVPITVHLDPRQLAEARAALNKHYTGDEECNTLVDGEYIAKYPQVEKEVPIWPSSHYAVGRDYQMYMKVELLTDGTLRPAK